MKLTLNLNDRTDLPPERLEEFKKQRIERGFADCDWWNLYDYLLLLLPNILEVFKNSSHGVAGLPLNDPTPLEERRAEWESVLQEMIGHFRRAAETGGLFIGAEVLSGIIDQAKEKEELKQILAGLPEGLLSVYESGGKDALENAERIKDIVCDVEMKMGFDLLKEHFWKLWD